MFVIGESKRRLIYVPQIAFLTSHKVAIGIKMATHKKKAFYDVWLIACCQYFITFKVHSGGSSIAISQKIRKKFEYDLKSKRRKKRLFIKKSFKTSFNK